MDTGRLILALTIALVIGWATLKLGASLVELNARRLARLIRSLDARWNVRRRMKIARRYFRI